MNDETLTGYPVLDDDDDDPVLLDTDGKPVDTCGSDSQGCRALATAAGCVARRYHPWMINAMHVLLYSRDPAADRAFFRDVLGWPYVENVGSEPGWLIFKTPPTELGIHPTDGPPAAEVSLMCDDIDATVAMLAMRGVRMTDVDNRGYGVAVDVTLPGGGTIQLYEPRHEIAHNL